jgi:hypothetical protein
LESLSNSKVSHEVVTHILRGDSVIWVVVESGNAELDAPFISALQKRLHYLQQVVRIPEADPTDLSSKPGPGTGAGVEVLGAASAPSDNGRQIIFGR